MTESVEQITDLKNIDKSNWKTYRFDEIAFKSSESVDPNNTDLEIYVGLEHIDSESLHIKRFGTRDDVNGKKFRCRPGDIIFGRRRAYQRKAAVVTFDGFCSAHSLVLRANPEVIDPKLFPFFMHSDSFMHRAVDISVGSLSPTINWGTLKSQEFLLPPKDQQARLAELLWAADEVVERENRLKDKLDFGFKSYRKKFIQNGYNSKVENQKKIKFGIICKEWKTRKLSEFASIIGGGAFKSKRFVSSGNYQVLRIGNTTDKGFDLNKSPVFVKLLEKGDEKYLIPKNSMVLSLTGTNGKRDYGFPTLMKVDKKYLLNQRLAMIIPDKKVMHWKFLFFLSKMELFKGRFFLNANGSANQANVSINDVANIELPVPEMKEQELIVEFLEKFINPKDQLNQVINSSKTLQKSLINQIF